MISSIGGTVSALQAYRQKMEVTADNIANVNTEQFKKSKATVTEGLNGDVRLNIRRGITPGYHYQEFGGDKTVEKEGSNVDLGEEIPEMMITQRTYEANLKMLQTHDNILGSLLDIVS
ncbi:MAG: flagellar basal body rod C-terminal domain-containing protein [Desulfobacterales bacterium]|jgi:flagellar basal-body rod protein FlgC